ncbi:MAG: 50S ribosomal protein L24 [bacterium]|nr:50S ribosomal protein L24 [bacterium]
MRVKKGDIVKIRSGRDGGKTGKVLHVLRDRDAVIVEGVNLLVKHLRPRRQGEKGQRVQFPAALPMSRVSIVCPKCGKPTRSAAKLLEDGSRLRRCVRCDQTFA